MLERLVPMLLRQAAPMEWRSLTTATSALINAASFLDVHNVAPACRACRASLHTQALLSPRPTPSAHEAKNHNTLQPSSSFTVQVAVKAFEQRYLDQASNTIADLMFIHFAPKSGSWHDALDSLHGPSNLSMTLASQRVRLNWKKTRFTVIRGPHIDKTGMEAFEMRKYKAVATATSHSSSEVQWFMDSLRLYQFPGVQIQVLLSNNSYLTPTHIDNKTAATQPLLSEHRKHILRYLGAAAVATQGSVQAGAILPDPQGSKEASLRETLRTLRQVLYTGFQRQRKDLARSLAYSNWFTAQKLNATSALKAQEPLDTQTSQGTDHMIPKPEPPTTPLTDLPEHAKHAAAFLAAADTVLLGLDLDALESHKHYPYHFITYRVGQHKVPAAEWMQAVLVTSQVASALETAHQDNELQAAYASYSLFSHSLLSSLFKLWMQQTSAQLKPYLALPSEEQVKSFIQQPSRT